jgi:glycerophosphoryl diester phosphodiesterase
MASLLSSGAATAGATTLIAHRGASHDAPENTLAALRLGYEQGADAGECDVHLTRDGRIAVIHDPDTTRVTGHNQPVSTQTLAELHTLNAGQWGKWQGSAFSEKIPELAEVLALVPAGKRLFIETKVGAEILPELERVIRASGLASAQLPLITFDLETAREMKRRLPAHEVCWIVGVPRENPPPAIEILIEQAKAAGLDGLDLNFRFPIDAAFARKVHAAGLTLYTWTVDDPAVARAQAAAGVDGITTNRPGWMRAQLASP